MTREEEVVERLRAAEDWRNRVHRLMGMNRAAFAASLQRYRDIQAARFARSPSESKRT